jgi:dolichyl-phosphate beta-glucosyltransferase
MGPSPTLSLSIVIPAFNEEARIRQTLHELAGALRQHTWDWEIRVVDDGSVDATAGLVEEFARQESRVCVQREPHRGKGGAVRAGMLAARGAFRFLCDADLSMPIHELERFLPPRLTGFDVAIATREGHGARRIGEPLARHLMGRAFNWMVKALMFTGIQDTQCGFKMFTTAAVESIFPLVSIEGWAFDIEVLEIARRRRLTVVEVPIEWHYRPESQISVVRDGFAMLREVLRIRARARRGEYD